MARIIQQPNDILNVLGASYFFRGFDEEILKKLAQGTRLVAFDESDALFFEGEACSGLYILHTGIVKLFKISTSGREFILRVLEAGASFNEVPVFDGGLNPVNATSLEASQVWIVDKKVIQSVLSEHPDLYPAIIQRLAANLRMLVQLLEDLAFFQVTQRLARLLLQESARPERLKNIKQDELAARLGTVREVVSRSLKELERCGAIRVERRQIQILELDRLRECS